MTGLLAEGAYKGTQSPCRQSASLLDCHIRCAHVHSLRGPKNLKRVRRSLTCHCYLPIRNFTISMLYYQKIIGLFIAPSLRLSHLATTTGSVANPEVGPSAANSNSSLTIGASQELNIAKEAAENAQETQPTSPEQQTHFADSDANDEPEKQALPLFHKGRHRHARIAPLRSKLSIQRRNRHATGRDHQAAAVLAVIMRRMCRVR